jgi:hypothetical protein
VTDEETELRVLLERGVPQLPAPARRLERVRDRVRRRARRRAAGLSVAAVTVVAAAGLLLPGVRAGDRSADPDPPGVTTFAPAGSGTPSPTDGPTTDGVVQVHDFPALAGLQLHLPRNWFVLEPPVSASDTVFVASQPLGLPKDACVHPLDGFCTPLVRSLGRGGVLMMLQLRHNQGMADKMRVTGRRVGAEPALKSCVNVGGTSEMGATLVDDAGSAAVVNVTVCLARPTGTQQAQARDVLMNADFN